MHNNIDGRESASARACERDNHEMKPIMEHRCQLFLAAADNICRHAPTTLTGREKANPWVDERQIAAAMARLRSNMMLVGLYFVNAIVFDIWMVISMIYDRDVDLIEMNEKSML